MPVSPVELNLKRLPPYRRRIFLPETVDLRDKDTIVELHQRLLDRAIESRDDLEKWLLDRSELEAALQQEGSVLYIQMTCQTDDQEKAQAYKDFIETVIPAVQPLNDQLNRKYLQDNERFPLDENRYGIYSHSLRTDVELFRKENIPLQTRLALLSQDYQTVCGAMTVEFQGKERTLPEMSKFLLEPDRVLREEAWRATAQRRLRDRDKLDDLFEQMLGLRDQIARNAEYPNYRDYQFRAYHRFDYTPDDCKLYHKTVERVVVPIWKKILEKRRREMTLENLRPWDLSVDPHGRPPLKPFTTVDELTQKVVKIFERVNAELGSQFRMMAELGLLDLASRKGKAPGGYQSTLAEVRKPFIFMNAVGVHDDVNTLLHEGGHAFHSLACAHDPLAAYRHGPMEFNEVASMGMELLGGEHLGVFYGDEEIKRCRREHFEGTVHILCWVAAIDAFQHWIYENPKAERKERTRVWTGILRRFGTDVVDWSGLEEVMAALWHRQLHIFEVPFYYIEYGIAQLGALQLWVNAKKDFQAALKAYREGLALGGSRPLPELYQTAGLKFDFSEKTIAPLMDAVMEELRKLS
jgi:oligoendopeptidase F